MSSCQLCGEESKLIKAHIIPEAFFRVLRIEEDTLTLITSTPGVRPKRAPIGVYDTKILCGPCERKFDHLDDYGINVLLVQFHAWFKTIEQNGQVVAYRAEQVDQEKLLRFLVAVLWRASVSKQSFYGRVHLGPYESLARQTILRPEAELPPVFSALLSRWTYSEENKSVAQSLMCPFRERWQGVNAYRMYLGEVVAYVKVDNRSFHLPLRNCALREQPGLNLVARSLEKSKDLKSMVHTVTRSDRNIELLKLARRNANAP